MVGFAASYNWTHCCCTAVSGMRGQSDRGQAQGSGRQRRPGEGRQSPVQLRQDPLRTCTASQCLTW